MKTRYILSLALSAAFILTTPVLRADEPKKGAEEHEKGEKTKIPETAEGILKAIHTEHGELKETVAAKKLADVHHHAFAIRDLAAALPAKAAADKKAAVEATSKNIAKLADALDKAGDDNDAPATAAGMKKLEPLLKMLDTQFAAKTK